MPVFRFDKAFGIARGVKAFLKDQRGSAASDAEREEGGAGGQQETPRPTSEQKLKSEIESKKRELRRIRKKHRATKDRAEYIALKRKKKTIQQEIFELESEGRAAEDEEPGAGALPYFVIIGAQKGGTTFLYNLLTQHPLVQPAASKELHFFNALFDEGVDWYCRCFPRPGWEDGRRTITGEATPSYLFHPHAAKRMAEVIPHARLIALLRNPVDRAYSHYQMAVRRGFEHLKFEEAIEAEEARLRSERDKILEDEHYTAANLERFSYLSRGIYVDQLVLLSRFFSEEQTLVLKSEDFFKSPQETLKTALTFLGLPHWEPEVWASGKKRRYEREMDQATRRHLEEYFEPHNRRLYEFLGVDFGW